MKKWGWILLCCMGLPGYGLTFVASTPVAATNKDLLRILPRPDEQDEPSAVLFIKTDILNVAVRGHVVSVPRRVHEGYVLFVPQGATQLTLNAPLYATQQITFPPMESGKYYEMTLEPLETKEEAKAAKERSKELDLNHTQVGLKLDFDYMKFPKAIRQEAKYNALVYLDKRLDFSQWRQLLMPNGPYRPFDVSGNQKNPCCILVQGGAALESVFFMKRVEMDTYVEEFESGNTYHATLTLTPKEK